MVPNSNSDTFQVLSDTEIFVLESNYTLWLELYWLYANVAPEFF